MPNENLDKSKIEKLYKDDDIIIRQKNNLSFAKVIFLTVIFGVASGVCASIVFNAFFQDQFSLTGQSKETIAKDIADLLEKRKIQAETAYSLESGIKSSVDEEGLSIVKIFPKKLIDEKSKNPLLDGIYNPNDLAGNGIVLTSDGWIVTTKKVVPDLTKSYELFTFDNEKFEVSAFVLDPASDLIFFKIAKENLPVVKLADKDSLSLGQLIAVVSAKTAKLTNIEEINYQKIVKNEDYIKSTEKFWQSIKLKDSLDKNYQGAIAVTLSGEMAGIVMDNNVISSDIITRAMKDAIKSGAILRPVLGVKYLDLSSAYGIDSQKSQNRTKGALVLSVEGKSAGEMGKIRPDDIIIKVKDIEVDFKNNLSSLILDYHPEEKVALTVLRNKEEIVLEITLK